MNETEIKLIRHTLATLAYRCAKTIRGADDDFGRFKATDRARMPIEILSHIGDLLDWALTHVEGDQKWIEAELGTWHEQGARFHESLGKLDARLASGKPVACSSEKLFQGPIADALTHVGQLAMLRNLAGIKISGENYYVAEIETGRTGEDQPTPVYEF